MSNSSIDGCPDFQYFGLRAHTVRTPGANSLTTNGPVPMGLWKSYVWLLTMVNGNVLSVMGMSTSGSCSSRMMVSGPSALASLKFPASWRTVDRTRSSLWRMTEKTMSYRERQGGGMGKGV